MDDMGFSDLASAQRLARKLRRQRLLSLLTEIVEVADHRLEADGNTLATVRDQGIDLVEREGECAVADDAAFTVGGGNVCHEQQLQRIEVILQLLKLLLSDPANFILPSDDAPDFAPGSEGKRIARDIFAHRLSENRK
ncbi:MAG: hypothetical protein B7Y00_00995 [Sphingomonadales bacterium 17-56-6]|nr:MAG: hypothetical protein B7Y00_00995 [Sphingomonadales bacterium 17-56-6]